ncbi:hypothetical protein [Neobacillus piezotolerans]|nr:hypothetical protein [Neobacillus piezotolerans]
MPAVEKRAGVFFMKKERHAGFSFSASDFLKNKVYDDENRV